ncbi:small, acid-soluble spore protein, H family [Paenibacillus sp. CAA11]|uniref:small, acid-soluble spore protein, H family n=1 Tax=Paenibacillus sp. CAA11 TaxID=1532905 RepID=UPI001F2B4E15|nr:small, acid-soluble spore protein, H family [Paenibacillus sp. CAA11]
MLDIHRAQAILESPNHIQVKLDGENVWIDRVDAASNTVQVHPEKAANEKSSVTVAVDRLQEIK